MGLSARNATAALLLSATGCGATANQPPVIGQMTPSMANSDLQLQAIILGTSFRPIYEFDAVSGDPEIDVNGFSAFLSPSGSPDPTNPGVTLSGVTWEAEDMLQAVVPPGIPLGTYDLLVRDPRGQSSRLREAFDSLGPDLIPPIVTIASPPDDGTVGARAEVAVVVQVNDGAGQVVSLGVNVRTDTGTLFPYDCSTAAKARTACAFSFTAPNPQSNPAVLYIDATAIDGGGNVGKAETLLDLVPAPAATSLAPGRGSVFGGSSVTVLGANFLAGATGVMFDGLLARVTDQSITSIAVVTPPHVAGKVDVTVEIGGAAVTVPGGFLYVDPPIVREISPSGGPVTGGTAVRIVGDNFSQATEVRIGETPLLGTTFQNANLIEGFTPPGTGVAVVTTSDPILDAEAFGMARFTYRSDAAVTVGTDAADTGLTPGPDAADTGLTPGPDAADTGLTPGPDAADAGLTPVGGGRDGSGP